MKRKSEANGKTKLVLALPVELGSILGRHREIPWARVAEEALWRYARKVQLADRIASCSKLSAASAAKLGREVKAGLRRRYSRSASR